MLIVILFLININCIVGRMRPSRHSCPISYKLQTEIDNLKHDIDRRHEHIEILDKHNKHLQNTITINNCKEGQQYNLDRNLKDESIMCTNCHLNYYRTKKNNTCIKCPPGYYSNEGAVQCIKSKTNDTNVHTLCEVGTIVPNDKFAKGCVKCDKNKKKYMPYKNNNDKCLICPPGSIVTRNSDCIQCSEGEYEENNKCLQCTKGTYSDSKGMDKCKICENQKSFAYFLDGSTNCDDSIIYTINDNINSAISNMNLEIVLDPLSNMLQTGASIVINNRKPIIAFAASASIVGTCFLTCLIGFIY
jgi:hypothetical protein